MQKLVFWITYPILLLISKLPFPLFYLFSDFVFFFVFYVFSYRKKTVFDNLKLVFPEKDDNEIKKIRKQFFHHMVDMFLEMIKSISISEEELKKRFVFTNLEEIDKIRAMNKSIVLICGHYASYEWMNALQLYGYDYRGFGIYKKVANPYFDKLAKDIRARYDGELIRTVEATQTITKNQKNGVLGIYGMIADQTPRVQRAKYWAKFMGITVPVFTGTEKLAKNLDMVVTYLHVEKVKRGYYQATFETITYNPETEKEFAITDAYLRKLEKQIHAAPQYYLWTHKRWKFRNYPIPKEATVID